MFKRLFDKIHDKDLYKVFLLVYTSCEYGFGEFNKEMMLRIINCKPEEYKKEVEENLSNKVDENGFITVYRGVGSKSTPLKKAYSWTTNLCVALFFATRYSQKGKVYTGKVHINDVIAYIDSRNENEILALPEKVIDTKQIKMLDINDIYFHHPYLVEDYVLESKDIKRKYFSNPDGIHGVLHSKRVLLLAYIISLYQKLNYRDLQIILTAAKYHDIGRMNDKYDKKHGIKSFKKMQKLGLIYEEWDEEDINILQYIIENHCISDEEGIKKINEYQIQDRDRALLLYKILKDADGLDRVRLEDLDINYLRLPISKSLVMCAYEIYANLK